MNISLAPAKKKAKGSTKYGLNKRGARKSNVFGGSDDDDDDDGDGDSEDGNEPLSERGRVNKQIAKEQAALRKRAQAAAAALEHSAVYDYDAAYDSFKEATKEAPAPKDEDKKSRYIGDLLKAAKKRNQEREAVIERKVAREQAEEDAKEEYRGKEKFVTKAYKRKLEERKRLEEEDAEREREEEANDVTKKTGGAAFASFYGNFNKNVAMGGTESKVGKDKDETNEDENDDFGDEFVKPAQGGLGFLAGFEKSEELPTTKEPSAIEDHPDQTSEPTERESEKEPEQRLSMREIREKKIAEARDRKSVV